MAGTKSGRSRELNLSADDVIDAAMSLLVTEGLEAVSMRRVAGVLGVSPIPVYRRIGNKDALLDAMAARLAADFLVPADEGESWDDYARRWCQLLRERHLAVADDRLLLRGVADALRQAIAPLIEILRNSGIGDEESIDMASLLCWGVLGHVAIESRCTEVGVDEFDLDKLFGDHVEYLIMGLQRHLM